MMKVVIWFVSFEFMLLLFFSLGGVVKQNFVCFVVLFYLLFLQCFFDNVTKETKVTRFLNIKNSTKFLFNFR